MYSIFFEYIYQLKWGLILRLNNLFFVSIILLTIIFLGAVSAADNDEAVDDLMAEDKMDEMSVISSDVDLDSSGDINDVADSIDVNDDSKLGISDADEKLSAGNVAPNYTIEVTPSAMSGSTYVAQYGEVITVKGDYGNATGNVSIRFGYSGNYQDFDVTLVDGKFSHDLTKYTVRNNYQISVKYNGDDYYKSASWSKNIHIQLNDVESGDADYGQIAYIIANLHNATGNVNFTINGKTYTGKLENGAFTQEFKNYTLGKNSVKFYYEGDERFNPLDRTINFNVKANIDEPTVYNYQPVIINAYLGEATGKVNFTYNGNDYTVDIVNGVASKEIKDYEIGENSVKVSYSGDKDFDPFNKEIKFTVLDKQDSEIYSAVYQNNGVNVVSIYIPYSNGTVNVSINGKKMVLELVDGQALYEIGADDEINNVKVVYDGNVRLNPGKSTEFLKLDHVVNENTWKYYFNQQDGGKLFNFLPAGITLDFQGDIINYDDEERWFMDINKPVNVISSTHDAFVDLNTMGGSLLGEDPGSAFIVSYGGSGSNISDIDFHNTQLWISNTSYVVFDHISNVVEDQRVGSGVGATSVRDNSSYVTIKNSYFYTRNNGGSTTFTFSWANHCVFDNNTVKIEGNVGNMLYLNIMNIANFPNVTVNAYGGKSPTCPVNTYNKFTNNRLYGKEGSAISIGIMVEGIYNVIENNTLYKTSISTSFGAINPANNSYIGNVLMEGSSFTAQPHSIIYNNIVPGTMSTGANSIAYNNTVGKAMTVGAGSEAYNNTVGGLTLSGANSYVHDNVVSGDTTISQANIIVSNNQFVGDKTIKFSSANAKNVTFSNNDVNGNIEFNAKAINNNIINNTITTSKDYAINLKSYTDTNATISDNILTSKDKFGDDAVNHAEDESLILDNHQNASAQITVSVENIKVGQTAIFNVAVNETSITSANIIVGTKTYTVGLVDGKGTLQVNDLLAGNYDVTVISTDGTFSARNTTQFNVTKNVAPQIVVDVPEVKQGVESYIVVTIADATGSVTFIIGEDEFKADLVNGVAKLQVPDLDSGKYNLTVKYSGDDKYLENETNSSFTVNQNKDVSISFSALKFNGVADEIIISFKDYQGFGIYNADVTVTVNGKVYDLVTDYDGEVSIVLDLTRGKYPINVVFDEIANKYDKTTVDEEIIVQQKTLILIEDISDSSVIGVLKDIDGNPIADAKIIYSIAGGKNESVVTDKNGSFVVKPTQNGLINFTFEGDDVALGSFASIKLTNVIPATPTPTPAKVAKATKIKAANKKFKLKAKKKIVSVTLLSGKTKVKSKLITIKIKGKTYKAKTNKKGVAKVKVKLSKKGKYAATVKFAGDKDYKKSSKKIKIVVK